MVASFFPFFYAKVDIPLLRRLSAGGLSVWELQPSRLHCSVEFPQPIRQFAIEMRTLHNISDSTILRVGLNPRYYYYNMQSRRLYTGVLTQLRGYDGCWSLSTPCQQCTEHVLMSSLEELPSPRTCSTPNCANNTIFRSELLSQRRILCFD